MKVKYLSKKRLEELHQIISDKDKDILRSLEKCRYLSTGQVRRLHFTDSKNSTAGHRMANWITAKLRNYGLVEILERYIGGVHGGSNAHIWTLTESGAKLLHLNDAGYIKRRRTFQPSEKFASHTLAIAEAYVRIVELCRGYQLELIQAELEPECWRDYTEDGKPATLKPDMFVITAGSQYEDIFFIEIDCGTEAPSKVMSKHRRYIRYHSSGIERKRYDVFPLVVWLVNSRSRQETLKEYLAEDDTIPEEFKSIFAIVMPDEFEKLILCGVEVSPEKGVA